MKDSVLVTGGNGYIGTQTVLQLKAAGYEPIVVDWVADTTKSSYTYSFDDNAVLDIMKRHNIKSVIHFAADHEVGRSVEEPSVFYNNNVVSSIKFLDKCIQAGVKSLSSVALVVYMVMIQNFLQQKITKKILCRLMVEQRICLKRYC